MTPSLHDRWLLFGLVALHHRLVARPALEAAFAAWRTDSTQALSQVLLEQQALTAEQVEAVEALVRAHVSQHGDVAAALDALGTETGTAVAVAGTPDTRAPSTAVSVASIPDTRAPAAVVPGGEQTVPAADAGLRYRVLRPHARGGLGEVFVALDGELNREVALKEIQARHADNADSRARFLLEAEVTGRLEHPGIVPVYGLGCYADGRPYYAMRFIKGQSLQDAAGRFHADAGLKADPGKRTLELRGLLGRFVAVCNAIAYAHSKGILHRDLKPANVMLGNYGETLVVDWGLAKSLGAREEETTGGSVTLRLSAAESGLTQYGSVLGTPQYMSPEQATGRLEELGPASDVYGLGATFYHLLTGQAPFAAGNVQVVLKRVCRGEFPPPRQIEPSVPAALEAICLRAMACKPEERYASAKVLADEVEHWLGDEPVAAYAEPLWLRLGRWRRRHPGLVTGTAALVFTVLAALGVGALLLSAEQGRTLKAEQAKVKEQEGRALAQVNALLDANPQAVPTILDGLRDFREQVRPRLRAARAKPEPAGATLAARRLWQQHRTRAALAILSEDREQLIFLKKRLLAEEVDPEEMLLIRNRLLPHKDALTAELWAEVNRRGVKEAGRFRALVALAAFDPKNARWAKVGREVVGPLLASEPLHVAVWGRGLSDVRAALMTPLAEAFRDRTRPTEARLAAGVLRDYAAERPAVLADLLADADGQQFPLLLEALRVHGEQAITLLQSLASGGRKPPESATFSGGLRPPLAVVEKIAKAHGLLTESFALCPALPLGEFAAVVEALRPSGYRPIRLRPYITADALLVAAVWQRDGRDWHIARGLTAAQLKEQDVRQRQRGYVAADVAGWRSGKEVVFGALWVKPRKDEDARLYAGVSSDNRVTAQNEWKNKGYVPATLQAVVAPDGKALYSGVWIKGPEAPKNWNLNWNLQEPVYLENLGDLSRQPVDVCLVRSRETRKSRAEQVAEAEKAVADKPGDTNALWRRGLAYVNADQGEPALADLDATVKKFPRFADGYRYRAIVRARLGRAEGARADVAEFLKLGTDASTKLHAAAVVAAYLGEEKEALRRLEETITGQPKDAGLLYDAGCVYALAARAVVHRQRAQGGAAVAATLAVPFAALALPQRLEQMAAAAQRRRRDHSTRALTLLRQAVAAGYDDFAHMDTDADLDGLRNEAAFQALLAQRHLGRRYGLVRHVSTTHEGTELHGLPLVELLRRGRELAARGYRPVGLSVVEEDGKLVAASVWQRPVVSELAWDRLGQRRANAAVALLKLGRPESAWPVFQHGAHPDAQTYVLHRAGPLGADVRPLLKHLDIEKDPSARQALILALGEYTAEQMPADVRQDWTGRLLGWYRDDADAGIHAAVDWLLRHGQDGPQPRKLDWGQAKHLQKMDTLASRERQRPEGRRWYVNGQGQTMVLLGPGEFIMGSPLSEAGRFDNELPHRRRVGRRFALASKKVTVAQFKVFLKAHPEVKHFYTERYSPEADGPITAVTWYEAAQYCRWLSEQEGVKDDQMCYPSVGEIEKCKDGKALKLPSNYLSRTGYRLPSEAEWEYGCRAGAVSSRFYGSSVEMLGQYGWYQQNAQDRTWPVGQKKPNGFGLFDMHGNTWDWCQESGWNYKPGIGGKPAADEEDKRDITDKLSRVLRGGAFGNTPGNVRSAYRLNGRPADRSLVGLRVARTYD